MPAGYRRSGCYACLVLGRLLRVARPDDWTGTLSRVVIGVAFVLLAVVVVLVRLPEAWVELAPQGPHSPPALAPQTLLVAEGGKIAFPRTA